MNYLILSNNAPGYHKFFNVMADNLRKDGHKIVIAVDSEYSYDSNELSALGMEVECFSKFWRENAEAAESVDLNLYADYPLNSALLPDFERAEVYGFGWGRGAEYYRSLQSALLLFFEGIIARHKIDLVIYENISNAFAHYAWMVAYKNGVGYAGIVGSRLPGRFAMVDHPLDESHIYLKIFNAIESGEVLVDDEVEAWVDGYIRRLEQVVPDYMKFNGLENVAISKRYFNSQKLKKFISTASYASKSSREDFQIGNPFKLSLAMFRRNFGRRLRLSSVRKYYSEPNPRDKFYLYPLHYHPESSTSVLSPSYLNELEVIRNIAFSLPVGTTLYVKDHVSAFGYPDLNFYKKVLSLPNVKILSPFENTKALIKSSEAVITLTSTVGYEALLLGKRVFLFGRVFYEFHKGVVKVTDPSNLFGLLKKFLGVSVPIDERYNRNFVASYYMGTYDGILNFFQPTEDVRALANSLHALLSNEFLRRSNLGSLVLKP